MSRLHKAAGMYVIFASLSLSMAVPGFAQSPKMGEPYQPKRLEEYVAYTALWRTDANFHSTIKIANQLASSELDATPTLYMADGTAWDLPPVHLGKSAVEVVDVNAALAQAPDTIRSHMSSYGSAAVRYHYDWQGAVYATVSILNLARSLEYNYPFVFPPDQGVGEKNLPASTRAFRDAANGKSYEGLWFRNSHNAGGFLALSNDATSPLDVRVTLSGTRAPVEKNFSIPSHNTELVNLQDLFGADDIRTGGITVTHSGRKGDLQLAGGLEDLTTGYSTNLPFSVPHTHSGHTAVYKYASVGIMANEQDLMLNFPAGLHFWPYAFFRNLADAQRVLHSQVYYMEGKAVKTLTLPDISLAPGEARELEIHDLMKTLPGITDVTLVSSYTGYEGEILSATGSTDSTGNYVFPVIAEPVAPSGPKSTSIGSSGADSIRCIRYGIRFQLRRSCSPRSFTGTREKPSSFQSTWRRTPPLCWT